MNGLLSRVKQSLTLEAPVTYWSFWATLLRGSPVLLVAVGLAALLGGEQLTLLSIAPVPFVFTAATLGFAVRAVDPSGITTSVGLSIAYVGVLWVTDVGGILLSRPTVLLWVFGVLTFAAAVAGFASPALHGRDTALAEAQREHRRRDGSR